MDIKKLISLVFALFLISPAAKAAKKQFVYCNENGVKTLNPAHTMDGTTMRVTTRIYDRLVDFSHDGSSLVPKLAESWKISKDGKSYTFKLRPGVQFHSTKFFKPTRAMTAKDVEFSFMRQHDKKHPYHSVTSNFYGLFHSSNLDKILNRVEVLGPLKVKFVLNRPYSPFLNWIAIGSFSIHSKEYADQLTKKGKQTQFDLLPIGTGPWKVAKHKQDAFLKYDAHEKYWDGKASFKRLVYLPTPESSVRVQKIKQGECDLIYEPTPHEISGLKGHKDLHIYEHVGSNVGYMGMNMKKAPFNNKLVRQAIAYALNRPNYLRTLYQNRAVLSHGPLSPSSWAYTDDVKKYDYNIKKAKELLKKAGLPNGFETSLWTLPISRSYIPDGRKLGTLIQQDLAKVGIKVKLKTYEWASYLAGAKRGDHDMVLLGWTSDRGEPDVLITPNLACSQGNSFNVARWCNKEFSNLITQATTILDRKERKKLYKKALQIFAEEVPWVPFAHAKIARVGRKNYEGFVFSHLEELHFNRVTFK